MTLASLHPVGQQGLASVLEQIEGTDSVLAQLREMQNLVAAAAQSDVAECADLLAPIALRYQTHPLLSYLAIRALADVESARVDRVLTKLLESGDRGARDHAAWAFASRRPHLPALGPLSNIASDQGFGRMMAELALETWLREMPELAERPEMPVHLGAVPTNTETASAANRSKPGLRIAQVLMQGKVDADLSSPGSGDGGGLITLQVGLTRELAQHPAVSDVFLVTRLIEDDSSTFARRFEPVGRNGTVARLPFGPRGYVPTAEMWVYRFEIEQGLRRFLTTEGPFDAIHLRFADVGTFAAARLADELDIPIFFTLAPDPHGVIAAWEDTGELTLANFGEFDRQQHLFFRAWLVGWMLARAERLALLPRVEHAKKFQDLLGVNVESDPDRFVVIPEGVDYAQAEAARQLVSQPLDILPAVLADLDEAVGKLSPQRQGLPVLLSVGRMSRVKGMHRVVRAWLEDPRLSKGYNLVLVGGDLADPSAEETLTVGLIDAALDGRDPVEVGLVMLGSRSNSEVSLVMAASVAGLRKSVAPNGIYVAGSEKEEFGLAIVEAMAAGMPVVAPQVGGPGTYIEHGMTGYLADTTSSKSIADGIKWADSVRASEVRAAAARNTVRSTYSISSMADDLVSLYGRDQERHSMS